MKNNINKTYSTPGGSNPTPERAEARILGASLNVTPAKSETQHKAANGHKARINDNGKGSKQTKPQHTIESRNSNYGNFVRENHGKIKAEINKPHDETIKITNEQRNKIISMITKANGNYNYRFMKSLVGFAKSIDTSGVKTPDLKPGWNIVVKKCKYAVGSINVEHKFFKTLAGKFQFNEVERLYYRLPNTVVNPLKIMFLSNNASEYKLTKFFEIFPLNPTNSDFHRIHAKQLEERKREEEPIIDKPKRKLTIQSLVDRIDVEQPITLVIPSGEGKTTIAQKNPLFTDPDHRVSILRSLVGDTSSDTSDLICKFGTAFRNIPSIIEMTWHESMSSNKQVFNVLLDQPTNIRANIRNRASIEGDVYVGNYAEREEFIKELTIRYLRANPSRINAEVSNKLRLHYNIDTGKADVIDYIEKNFDKAVGYSENTNANVGTILDTTFYSATENFMTNLIPHTDNSIRKIHDPAFEIDKAERTKLLSKIKSFSIRVAPKPGGYQPRTDRSPSPLD